ncbi:hypothetical protein GGP80_003094, partial [Salinibacter ruber]|nr:hypothetical protein [Salinibacter ruber]
MAENDTWQSILKVSPGMCSFMQQETMKVSGP